LRFFPKTAKNTLEVWKMNIRTFGRGIAAVAALFVINADCAGYAGIPYSRGAEADLLHVLGGQL
jgi:hypothetical protein